MKYFLIFAFLAVACAHHEHSKEGLKVKAYQSAIMDFLDKDSADLGSKMKCFKDQLLTTRHDELTAKVEDVAEFFESISGKLEKIFADPATMTKSDVGHFHRQCSEVRGRVLAFANVLIDASVFCQGVDKTKTIIPASINAIFDKLCVLEKNDLVDLLTRRTNECYLSKRETLQKCVADNYDFEAFEKDGFCGLKYQQIFGCTKAIFNECSPQGGVNLSDVLLNVYNQECN